MFKLYPLSILLWSLLVVTLTNYGEARIIGSKSIDQIRYPIIERPHASREQQHREIQQQTMHLTMSQLEQLKMLSYSDDSAPKTVDVFYLGLYETEGDLPSLSLTTIVDGVDAFVHAEMNAIYENDKNKRVKSIQTKILGQKAAASSRRSLEIIMGSNLETQVSVSYANEPSPDTSDVTSKVISIFEDSDKLQYLLSNITSRRTSDDSALSRVNAIYFFKDAGSAGSPPPVIETVPTPAPVTDGAAVPGIQDDKEPVESDASKNPSWKILNPIIISATLLLVLVALFVNHRRRLANSSGSTRSIVQAIDESHKLSTVDLLGDDGGAVNLFWESDDLFSIEAALVEASNNTSKGYVPNDSSNMSSSATSKAVDFLDTSNSPEATTLAPENSRGKATADDQSDIFSGIVSGFIENFSTMSSPRYVSEAGNDSLESPLNGGIAAVASSPMNGGVGDSRSVFSFLSGFASKASTVVASNVTKSQNPTSQQHASNMVNSRNVTIAPTGNGAVNPLSPSEGGRLGGTPHSRVSSLFTFSEEDSEDLVSSSDERSKEPRKKHGLLLGAPSDEEADEDNESLTALATSAVKSNNNQEEELPTIVNGTSVIVANIEPVQSQSRIKELDQFISQQDNTLPAAAAASQVQSDFCEETCGNVFKTQESQDQQQRAATVDEVLTDLTMGPNESYGNHQEGFTRLSAEEITKIKSSLDENGNELSVAEIAKELEEAERENKQLKKLSTRWTMSVFSPSAVESPAAATYNGNRVADLASPSSLISNKSEPSNTQNTMIQLQWDDPAQSSLNRVKAAAFAESVAGGTAATGRDSASERYKMFTGRSMSRRDGRFMNTVKERMSTKSAGHADGTNLYQIDTAEGEEASIGSSKGSPSPKHNRVLQDSTAITPGIDTVISADRIRVHAKNTTGDGTKNYQDATMADWSVGADNDDPSLSDSDSGDRNNSLSKSMDNIVLGKSVEPVPSYATQRDDTPRSAATNSSAVSGLSMDTPIVNSEVSPSKQLISDLLWLEHKIASTNQAILTSPRNQGKSKEAATILESDRLLGPRDSLSFASNDGITMPSPGDKNSSNDMSLLSRSVVGGSKNDESMSVHQSIVCRDCFAPPGKLKIVIHSTKDGPAVHTVKKGSSLEGHIFAGDLIISVDDIDTRSYSAEQVMKMMTAKTRFERKITVLHFEQERI